MAVLAEPNTSSKVVQEAQKLLNKSSNQCRAPENGAFDEATVAAIKQFQIESGMRPTGQLDSALMATLKKVANKPIPTKQVKVGGKIYLFTDAEHKALIKRLTADFRDPMRQLESAVAEARGYWDNQNALLKDQYIVGWCIEAWASVKLPPESLIKTAENGAKAAKKALDSGDLKSFSVIFPKAQKQANDARAQMKKYVAKIIDGGEGMVTGLEIISTSSFIIVGIIAAPVAAGYGLGAVSAGIVAGAGTAAVETLSHEVGKGISGQSKGVGDAVGNVLRDAFIGGSIGALVKGKGGEKILAKLAPMVAKKLSGELFKKASEKVVVKFMIGYFKKNGADILEGIMKETLKSFKSRPQALTFDAFIGIVVKEVVTAGIFGKFGKAVGDIGGKEVFAKLGGATKREMLKQLGDGAKDKELLEIFTKCFDEVSKENAGKVYDKVLGAATGSETPEKIKKDVISQYATDAKLLAAVKAEVAKRAKKKK